MTTSFVPVLLQLFDDYGDVLEGGKVYTYEAGTTTPLATYQDLAGATPNTNPVVLNAAGRADIRVTDGVAYKFILKDADGVTISTQDNIIIGSATATDSESQYLIPVTYCGTPADGKFMGGASITHACTIPANFDGATGAVLTNPGSSYIITAKKNGSTVGTITISTSGVFTFATSAGATVPLAFGDELTFIGPASAGTAADFVLTVVADLD
jgi:hypothetical protein